VSDRTLNWLLIGAIALLVMVSIALVYEIQLVLVVFQVLRFIWDTIFGPCTWKPN
jgi:hypothetical protein